MKTFRSKKGPFAERPHYSQLEIEEICTSELRKVNLFPATPEPIRIERFIEKRFGVTPSYVEIPDDVLGFTVFGPRGVEEIVVSKSLVDSGKEVSERRVNTTLAHEAGHGLLQAHLFASGMQSASLFDDMDPNEPKILCRDVGASKYDGRWWEYQANQAIGALLLPKPLVEKCISDLLATGSFGIPVLKTQERGRAIRLIADTFDVNPVVARIRVSQLFPESQGQQLTL